MNAKELTQQNNTRLRPQERLGGKKRLPKLLFIDTQPRQRIIDMRLAPYENWIAAATNLPLSNITTINVAEGEQLPTTFDGIDGIIGGGSGHSVTKLQPWMNKTADFFTAAHQEGIPELLICFSHQLHAYARKGQIETQQFKRFGLKEVRITPEGLDHSIFDGFPNVYPAFTSNSDVVTGKPIHEKVDVTELAQSSDPSNDPHEVFVYKTRDRNSKKVYTVQSHPELTAHIVKALAEQYNAFSSNGHTPQIDLQEIDSYDQEVQEHGRRLFGNWLKHDIFPLIPV